MVGIQADSRRATQDFLRQPRGETILYGVGMLQGLCVMENSLAAYFMVHRHRSKEVFQALIQDWQGILVSDGSGVYTGVYAKGVRRRQPCQLRGKRIFPVLVDSMTAFFGGQSQNRLDL